VVQLQLPIQWCQ